MWQWQLGAQSTPTSCNLGPPDHPVKFVVTSQRSQMLQFCLFINTKGAARGPLLPPNSPNLNAHFDAVHLYGLHLEVNT